MNVVSSKLYSLTFFVVADISVLKVPVKYKKSTMPYFARLEITFFLKQELALCKEMGHIACRIDIGKCVSNSVCY